MTSPGSFSDGKGQDAQRGARLAAHRVDVRQAIRRADPAEEMRIIHARREHVHGLHQAKVVGNPVDRGVVAGGQPGNHGGIVHRAAGGPAPRRGRRARSSRRSRRCGPAASASPATGPPDRAVRRRRGRCRRCGRHRTGRAGARRRCNGRAVATAPSRGGVWQNQFSFIQKVGLTTDHSQCSGRHPAAVAAGSCLP